MKKFKFWLPGASIRREGRYEEGGIEGLFGCLLVIIVALVGWIIISYAIVSILYLGKQLFHFIFIDWWY